MEPELAALVVESAVRRLVATYAHTMDDRDLDGCESLFFDDAVVVVNGDELVGRPAIRAWMDGLAASAPGRHVTMNSVISPDGERATVVSDIAFMKPAQGGGWNVLVTGRYRDVVASRSGQWGFERRDIALR